MISKMAKEILYDNRRNIYLVKEDYQEEAVFWANCPYERTETQAIERLRKSYENALNSAEWLAEKEAKEAFLAAGELIVSFFLTEEDAKKMLLGEVTDKAGNLAAGYSLSKMFNYITDNIPENLRDDFYLEMEKEGNGELRDYLYTGRQVKKSGQHISFFVDAKDVINNLSLERQMAKIWWN
jgi:hypothetical protein